MLSVISVSGMPSCVKLPRGEPRALQIGARFRHEHAQFSALLDGDADHPERGADAGRRECAGIAVRHHLAVVRHQFGAKSADRFVDGLLLEVHLLRFAHHPLTDAREF